MKDRTITIMTVVLALAGFVAVSLTAFAEESVVGWSGDVFLGYNKSGGNTNKSTGNLSAQALKKFEHEQILFKGNTFYSEANRKMDGQKWDLLNKYSLDFGSGYKWYSFFQVLAEHDFFADIDKRITPALGAGYHIAAGDSWIWDADAGLGYRVTDYRTPAIKTGKSLTALAHTFMKKKIFAKAFVSEDVTAYPGLKSGSGLTLRSETVFANPLQSNLDLEIKYIVDYNSKPGDKKKSDTQVVVGIKYRFGPEK
jgi:putative salt-induced outer membrane protein YdiY